MGSNIPKTEKFRGKTYYKDNSYFSKSEANKRVAYLHAHDVLAHIVPYTSKTSGNTFHVVYKRDEY